METDTQTGDPVLVGWNGDNPTAEIFRLRVPAKAGAGRVIFNTNSIGFPYSWNTGSRAVTAKDEKGNSLTSAEVIAKIEAGAAIQVIATVTDPEVEGNYTPNNIQIVYAYDDQTQIATIMGIYAFFTSNVNYVDLTEGRRLYILLSGTNVSGIVYKELGKKIDDLSNIHITSPMQDQVLTYNSYADEWENQDVPERAVVVNISTMTPLKSMTPNGQSSITLDTSMSDLYSALSAGHTVILRDEADDLVTLVSIGLNPTDGAIAIGGNSSGLRYFILDIRGGFTGTIICKVLT